MEFVELTLMLKSFKIGTSRVEYLKVTFRKTTVPSFSVSVNVDVEETFIGSSGSSRAKILFAANLALVKPKNCY